MHLCLIFVHEIVLIDWVHGVTKCHRLRTGEWIFHNNNTLIERITDEQMEVVIFHGRPPGAWSDVPDAPHGGPQSSVAAD